jgi:adenylate kinase
LGSCHLSTGDLFRSASCGCEPSGALKTALDAMKRGELVPDDLVVSMVRERAGCLRCRGGFLLDGFPRAVAQAEALDALLAELKITLDGVLSYELPTDAIVDRLSGRRTCAGCHAVYHVQSHPPRIEGVCDQCGARLVQRDDDQPESIVVRLRAYEQSTKPLTEYYVRQKKLLTIPATGAPAEIASRALRAVSDLRRTARV